LYLDPFAGTGRVHELRRPTDDPEGTQGSLFGDDTSHFADGAVRETVGIEIQPQWAAVHPRTHVGNALALPKEWTGRFDGIITSQTYGNRLADSHNARDASSRHSYTHDLQTMMGDPLLRLEPDNSGTLYYWQPEYATFHRRAWAECHRVTRADATLYLNVSNFIHDHRVQSVVGLHITLLTQTGWIYETREEVATPRMRFGANSEARVDHEVIIVARRI
jgi:hypothetical protein